MKNILKKDVYDILVRKEFSEVEKYMKEGYKNLEINDEEAYYTEIRDTTNSDFVIQILCGDNKDNKIEDDKITLVRVFDQDSVTMIIMDLINEFGWDSVKWIFTS